MTLNKGSAFFTALVVFFGFGMVCTEVTAQPAPASATHTRYRVIFISTFGGPNNHFAIYGSHILNDDGAFAGWADDSLPDPFPFDCWDGDCYVARGFRWKNGKMTDLGSLAAGFSSDTSWMSPGGLISGEAQTGLVDPDLGPIMHGTLFVHGRLIDLGTLDGGAVSLTTSVNDSAEVAGFAVNTIPDPYSMFGTYQTRAYRWKNGTMTDLGTLGGPDAMALRINQRGQIAGNSYVNLDSSDPCLLTTGGFLWENGTMVDLGGFGGSCTLVSDMNNRGEIVGGSFLAGDQAQHAFLWKRGAMTDLGASGGNSASALAINDQGDVVGFQTLPPDGSISHATLWAKRKIFDLGALAPDGCSFAQSVNSHLQVVGINSSDCDFDDDPSLRALISERGGPVVDLNTLIPADSGVQLRNASVINEFGEIVAVGVFPDGNHSPVLLVPCHDRESCHNDGMPPRTNYTPSPIEPSAQRSPWAHNWPRVRVKRSFGPTRKIGIPK